MIATDLSWGISILKVPNSLECSLKPCGCEDEKFLNISSEKRPDK